MAKNTVRVNVVGDSSSYERAMGRTQKTTETTGQKMTTFAKVAVAALAVKALDAVQNFVRGSHEAYTSLNESLNALEVTYGKHAEGIKALGRESAQSLGLSNAEFNTFAVSLSAFAQNIAGDAGDVVGVVDTLTTRVSDFASVMNLEVAEAARLFQSGLAGESEPLRKYGIDVSAATVSTYAYANGIAEAGEKLTEAQKVQARYGTILEQTDKVQGDFVNTIDEFANAQRVANAEMENSKAVMGEAFDVIFKAGLPVMRDMAEAAAVITVSLQGLTGQLTKQEVAIKQYELQMGKTADTAEDVITIWAEWGVAVKDLLPLLGLSTEELMRLRDADEDFLKSLGWTEEGIRGVAEAIDKELAKKMDEGADAVHRGRKAQEDFEVATEDATDAIKDQADELRAQTDPLFAVYRAQVTVTEAKKAYTEALNEGGPGSDAAIAAAWELTRAEQSLDEALLAVRESGMSRAEFEAWQTGMGRSAQEAGNLADNLENIQGFVWPNPTVKLKVDVPTIQYINDDGRLLPHESGRRVLARGGVGKARRGGIDATIAEDGTDEAVIPLDQRGVDAMSKAVNQFGGGGGGVTIIVQGSLVTENELADFVQKVLLQKQKRSGGLGIAG